MKATNLIKYALLVYYARRYFLEKTKEIKSELINSFEFEPQSFYGFEVFLDQRKIKFYLDLWITNKSNTDFSAVEKALTLNKIEFYSPSGKVLGNADLNNVRLNFKPGEKKLIKGIRVNIYFKDIDDVKYIIKNWPDIELPYTIYYKILNKDFIYQGMINPKNLTL